MKKKVLENALQIQILSKYTSLVCSLVASGCRSLCWWVALLGSGIFPFGARVSLTSWCWLRGTGRYRSVSLREGQVGGDWVRNAKGFRFQIFLKNCYVTD